MTAEQGNAMATVFHTKNHCVKMTQYTPRHRISVEERPPYDLLACE